VARDADVVAVGQDLRALGERVVFRDDHGAREVDARDQRIAARDAAVLAGGQAVLEVDA
jgi:hypothetical protein